MNKYLLTLLALITVVSQAGYFADKNTIEGYSVIPTNGGTSTLLYNDPRNLVWTGSSNQIIKLPSATAMRVGFVFRIRNAGSGALSVQLQDGTSLHTIEPNVVAEYLLTAKGSSNGSWSIMEHQPNVISAVGDMVYGTTGGSVIKLSGNTTAGVQFLAQQGNGTVSAAPGWSTLNARLGVDTNSVISTLALTGSTNSTDPSSGALTVGSGGLGVGASAFFGGSVVSFGGVTSKQNFVIEDPGTGTNNITIQAPTLSSNYSLILPTDDGSPSQFLQTNGSGTLSWSTPAGSTSAHWSGYHTNACVFTRSSSSFGDYAADATCTLQDLDSVNISASTTGSLLPGISFRPTTSGHFYVCAGVKYIGATAGDTFGLRLVNGASVIVEMAEDQTDAGYRSQMLLCGITQALSTKNNIIMLQGNGTSNNTNTVGTGSATRSAIEWSLRQISF